MLEFIKRLLGSGTRTQAVTTDSELDDRSGDIAFTKDYARQIVRGGYCPKEEAIDMLDDCIKDFGLELSAATLIEDEINRLKTEQADWPKETDYDRLHAVMMDLENDGIVARENFTCCGTCGSAEIGDEIEAHNKGYKKAHGYTFFHQQDTESAVEGYGVYLNYGTALENGTKEDSIKVGHEIVRSFETKELDVVWDGDLGKRILVKMDWQRRWPH